MPDKILKDHPETAPLATAHVQILTSLYTNVNMVSCTIFMWIYLYHWVVYWLLAVFITAIIIPENLSFFTRWYNYYLFSHERDNLSKSFYIIK